MDIVAGCFFGMMILYVCCYFFSDEYKLKQKRKLWAKEYPVGTTIEIITLHKNRYENSTYIDKGYYTIVPLKEYFTYHQLRDGGGKLIDIYAACKDAKGNYYNITKKTEGDIANGNKIINKISEIKLKILELEERESKNEIRKSYSNSRKKNCRKGV